MSKRLSEYLEEIGSELHDDAYADTDGTLRPITKDECLAREVWKRALGYEEESENTKGEVSHAIHPPDSRMQQFIFERREGKIVSPQEKGTATLLEKIDNIIRAKINNVAEEITGEKDESDGPI